MCDFKIVTYKKNRNRKRRSTLIEDITLKDCNPLSCSQIGIPQDRVVKKIKSAKEDIEESTFYKNFIQQLNQENCIENKIDIVSYGIEGWLLIRI
ncbi:uncharacterized protein LOC124372438 isoform X2 [Homalodisca vitripennis]|uniref:uncharacterized protein LOC124372438 isoform X2 n=1 Tax=Homalodisca vitripennis TaxID=197043 RepID=UPI001EEC0EA3|nr:uncharacterized protein LOC124372438 isoform X2 [Homalodisca vitripennis]